MMMTMMMVSQRLHLLSHTELVLHGQFLSSLTPHRTPQPNDQQRSLRMTRVCVKVAASRTQSQQVISERSLRRSLITFSFSSLSPSHRLESIPGDYDPSHMHWIHYPDVYQVMVMGKRP